MTKGPVHVQETHGYGFLAGGGEMGERIRAHDWAGTPLGPPSSWPQALKTSVRLLLSTGHPMFLWWGPELIQFYNDAYRRSIGPERHPSALGQRGRECWAEIWDIIGPQIEQVMAGKGHTWNENQLVPITRHGRREDVYWTYSYGPIDEPTAPNGVGGVLVVCTETTEQVLAEQRLKAAEARWRSMFHQAPGFMCILRGPTHIFEFTNPGYRELVGNREIIDKPLRDALPEVEAQGFVALLDKVYATGEPHFGTATPVYLAQGESGRERRYVDFAYQPIRDAADEVTGILVAGYDVTERVTASEALREEDRRKDEFLAMLAHELRNPLAPIRNASELLLRDPDLDSKARHIGDLVGRQVSQLARMVDDLLDVSRITTGRIELQHRPVDLRHAVGLAVESVETAFREKHHEIEVTCDDGMYVEGDLARLVQAVANILTNAAKYTQPGGKIRVSLRGRDDTAVIEISDNGAGISEEMLPKVFDLFVQDNRTLDRAQGGLGIGLSVVQRLVQMHGGKVAARSDGLGKGSTFRITLPRIEPPAPATDQAAQGALLAKRVLVVDDNVDAADSLAQLLKVAGHHAEAVYDANDALERVETFGPDVVLLDIGLPEMDGYTVARRLRSRGRSLAIIAVTGYGQAADVELAREAGFDAHLTKPVVFGELERTLGGDLTPK